MVKIASRVSHGKRKHSMSIPLSSRRGFHLAKPSVDVVWQVTKGGEVRTRYLLAQICQYFQANEEDQPALHIGCHFIPGVPCNFPSGQTIPGGNLCLCTRRKNGAGW